MCFYALPGQGSGSCHSVLWVGGNQGALGETGLRTLGLCGLGCFLHDEDVKAGFDNEESSLCSVIIYATSASQYLCQ